MEKELTKEDIKLFYDWLGQFISHQGYDGYYNSTDGGEYIIVTTDGEVFYQKTYEYNDWIERKKEEYFSTKIN